MPARSSLLITVLLRTGRRQERVHFAGADLHGSADDLPQVIVRGAFRDV